MGLQRRIVRFSGAVQGVGFRYTARRASDAFQVTGYVRNLPDGRVEMVVEGAPGQIDAFVAAVQDRMGHYIREAAQQTCEATGEYDSFNIAL